MQAQRRHSIKDVLSCDEHVASIKPVEETAVPSTPKPKRVPRVVAHKRLRTSSSSVPVVRLDVPTISLPAIDNTATDADHMKADADVLNFQLALLMQCWQHAASIKTLCQLSSQITRLLYARRELMLKATKLVSVRDNFPIIPLT